MRKANGCEHAVAGYLRDWLALVTHGPKPGTARSDRPPPPPLRFPGGAGGPPRASPLRGPFPVFPGRALLSPGNEGRALGDSNLEPRGTVSPG